MTSTSPDTRRRAAIHARVAAHAPVILETLLALHADPELSGEEVRASARLAGLLEKAGFAIERGVAGMPTAFVARRRFGPGPVIAFLAEYDALPGIGHGCGHNLIAAASLGAALAASDWARAAGEDASGAGEVRLIGTPAEETVGGKVILAERGVFDGLDAALMVHAGSEYRVYTDSLACHSLQVTFTGRAAHAVAHPDKGINALDALVQLYIAVDQIRRSSRRDVRIPGVITEGGTRANIVPDRAVGQFSVRASSGPERDQVVARLRSTAEAIARALGCGVLIEFLDNPYDAMLTNRAIASRGRDHLAAEGISTEDAPREHKGSLDMGNVSVRVPSLHAYVKIAGSEVASHSDGFAAASVSEPGRAAVLLSSRLLAATAADLIAEPALLQSAREEFAAERARLDAAVPATPHPLIMKRPS